LIIRKRKLQMKLFKNGDRATVRFGRMPEQTGVVCRWPTRTCGAEPAGRVAVRFDNDVIALCHPEEVHHATEETNTE